MLPRLQPLQVRHTEELSGSKAWRRPGESPRKGSVPPEGNAFGVFQRNQQPSQKVQQISDLQLGKKHRVFTKFAVTGLPHIYSESETQCTQKCKIFFFGAGGAGFVLILWTKKQTKKKVRPTPASLILNLC